MYDKRSTKCIVVILRKKHLSIWINKVEKILYNLSISHLSCKIWVKKKSSSFIVDSCHYPWGGYVDESDTAKDDECGNIVSMVVIVVVGYILGMYLKCCCMCNLHLLSMSYPQNLLVTVYLIIIYCRTFMMLEM